MREYLPVVFGVLDSLCRITSPQKLYAQQSNLAECQGVVGETH